VPRRRERIAIEYQITFEAPFHCGTGLPAGLIHRSVQRDAEGFLMVPGSTVKGAVRERCERLARLFGLMVTSPHAPEGLEEFRPNSGPVHVIFGSRTQAGTLFFDDAKLSVESRDFFRPHHAPLLEAAYRRWQVQERTQVSLSRLTRTARPGALFTSEYGIQGLAFDGRIYGVVEDWPLLYQESTFALVLLVAGLLAVDRLGGNRSTGAGRCAIAISSVTVDGNQKTPTRLLEGLEEFALYQTVAEEG
jgi:CRISPR/Cas system CSM-associated protein Csm3 (group 7 of RAMP superfamily)